MPIDERARTTSGWPAVGTPRRNAGRARAPLPSIPPLGSSAVAVLLDRAVAAGLEDASPRRRSRAICAAAGGGGSAGQAAARVAPRGGRVVEDVDRVREDPGHVPARRRTDLGAVDAGPAPRASPRRPRPRRRAWPSFRMTHARARAACGRPRAGAGPAAARPCPPSSSAARRPRATNEKPSAGARRVDADVAAAAGQRVHDARRVRRGVAAQRPLEQHVVAAPGANTDSYDGKRGAKRLRDQRSAAVRVGARRCPRAARRPAARPSAPASPSGGVRLPSERVARVERVERGRAQRAAANRPRATGCRRSAARAPTARAGPSPSSGSPGAGLSGCAANADAAERRGRPRARPARRRRSGTRDRGCRGRARARRSSRPRCRRARARRRGSPRTASRRGCCGR